MKAIRRTVRTLIFVSLPLLMAGCSDSSSSPAAAATDASDKTGASVKNLQGEALPQAVIDAVSTALPGGTIGDATEEQEEGATIYEVEVTLDGRTYGVEVTADGTVLEVDEEDDDADDDEDGDDEDGDDDIEEEIEEEGENED